MRILAAAWLLVGAPGLFKVICISPEGHEAVEDLLALCCAPGARLPGVGFSDASPCQGCTDYPLAPVVDTESAQPDSHRALNTAHAVPLVTTPVQWDEAAAMNCAPGLERRFDPAFCPPVATSLRC